MKNGKQKMTSSRCTRRDLGATPKKQEAAARALALDTIEKLASGESAPSQGADVGGMLTLGMLTDLYEVHGLHGTGPGYRRDQRAKMRRIGAFLGTERPVVSLCKSDVEAFAAHRRSHDGVRQNTIHGDVAALKIACNWATEHRRADGRPLLSANPIANVRVARDTPRRPWASADRHRQLKAVADQLPPAFGVLLDLAWATGRRIGAILELRWQDISFELSEDAPRGAIRWYAGSVTNNKRRDQVVPVNRLARNALKRWREQCPGIASAWVFGAPKDPAKPLGRYIAKRWLRQAEELAELEHMEQGGWHMFRRGWATARKQEPLVDVAEAGGWRDTDTLIRSYQHADPKTTLSVVNGGA